MNYLNNTEKAEYKISGLKTKTIKREFQIIHHL
jgi:hypothetical protein